MNCSKLSFLFAGPFAFFILKSIPLQHLSPEGQAVLASTAWIAIWWITEVVEVEVTALLPILLFPLSSALKISEVTEAYGHPFIFLFLGGFILGLAIERWQLHQRMAFSIIRIIGNSPRKVLLGFMIATAFLSMWISNTATAIMMLPMALSVVGSQPKTDKFSKTLLLGIAYAASIGGMATLIGTPPNIIFAGIMKKTLDIEIPFAEWMLFALPFAIVLLIISWLYLSRKINLTDSGIRFQFKKPGPISVPEKRVALVFAGVAFLWITRTFLINKILPKVDDTLIAMIGALSLFIIPSGIEKKKALMDWETAKKLPWGILLIFGAGLAIARGFSETDLTIWLANQFLVFKFIPIFVIILIVLVSINFLTEITSNTATTSLILPILITLAVTFHIKPIYLLTGATLAASCAFMLPVATPPNAIIFGSGHLRIKEMARTGFLMNLFSTIVISLLVWFILPLLW